MMYVKDASSPKLVLALPELFEHARTGEDVLLQYEDRVYRISLAGTNVRVKPNGQPEKIDKTRPASFSTPPAAIPITNPGVQI